MSSLSQFTVKFKEEIDIDATALYARRVELASKKVRAGSRALSIANKLGGSHRAKALSLYSKSRANYRHALNRTRPPEKLEPHFFTKKTPFPCGVHIISTQKGCPASYFEPEEYATAEFKFVDKNGYPLDFVEDMIDDATHIDIEDECIKELTNI